MPRKYEKVSKYENEIIEMCNQGMTLREIGEKIGFTHKQMRDFKTRYNKKQKKINELKYIIDRKDTKIKRLEMENELMRDFLSLTERK